MKGFKEFEFIQLCVNPIDFRKGLYRLASAIESEFEESSFSGGLFLFTNRTRKNIRAIYWDKTVFAMWSKSLKKKILFLGLKKMLRRKWSYLMNK